MWGLIVLLIGHYIFDYLMQSREIAENKSVKFESLQLHVSTYIGGMSVIAAIVFSLYWNGLHGILGGASFAVILGLIHGVQDWYLWRTYKGSVIRTLGYTGMDLTCPAIKKELEDFKYWEDKAFYDLIGLDALLHTITIILLYWWFI